MPCSVVFGVTLRLLVITFRRLLPQSTPPLTTSDVSLITCKTVAVVHQRPHLQHLACCSVSTGSQGRYMAQNRDFCLPHLHLTPPLGGGSRRNIAMLFGTEKLEWCGYPTVKKFRRYVYSFWQNARTWQTHRQTDRQTSHDDIGRACIASRGKKWKVKTLNK